MQVELSNLEFDLIVEILQERQVALLREISKTDHFEFRHMLKTRAEILEGLLHKMGVTAHAP